MTKLDTTLQPPTVSYAVHPGIGPARRFIVPVTSPEADLTHVIQRVWELASAGKTHIHFIGLCDSEAQEPALRRTLVTLSAMLNYDDITADIEILTGNDPVGNLKSRVQKGDLIICWDEQRIGHSQKPLRWFLQSEPDVSLYLLSGLSLQTDPRPGWAARVIPWGGFILIILGFFLLQIKLVQSQNEWTTLLTLLTVTIEFWLIGAWNKLHL